MPSPVERGNPNRTVLTDRTLRALRPAAEGKREIVWDALLPGFGVRVTDRAIGAGDDNGKAASISFIVVKRRPGDRDPITHVIGSYNREGEPGAPGSLAHARSAARSALEGILNGINPREAEAERRREEARRRQDTVRTVAEKFIADHVARLRSARMGEALIRREILGQRAERRKADDGKSIVEWTDGKDARWRDRPVTGITRYDAGGLIKSIANRSPHQARKVAAAGSRMFKWAMQHPETDYGLVQNPFSLIDMRGILGELPPRERTLTDAELKDVWDAAGALAYPFGPLVRMLALTGQRLREISDARWTEIEDDVLTVPSARMKGKAAHAVPLTERVKTILKGVPRFDGFIFTTTGGKRPVSGFSKVKARLDRKIAARREKEGRAAMPGWKIHDIRRTVRTRLSSLGVLPFLAEMVIAHQQTGIHKVYDLHRFTNEKREVLAKWEAALLAVVEPKKKKSGKRKKLPHNVVRFRKVRRRA